MLKLKNVQSGYGNILAIKDVSLEINEGEIITLIGANGAGKSTTLMTICGIVEARAGSISFLDQEINGKEPDVIVKMGLCQVPEGRHIFPLLTVKENLDMGAFLRTDQAEIKRDMDYVFSLFPILADRRNQDGGTLSGGEQQMLAIGRSLMSKPRFLMLDEPSLGLAPKLVIDIFGVIKNINGLGVTVMLVEQNAVHALQLSDRGYVLENGRVVLHGTGEELLGDDRVRTAYLGL
jgi:branched-chain amino acid transport system ATP-binding protein